MADKKKRTRGRKRRLRRQPKQHRTRRQRQRLQKMRGGGQIPDDVPKVSGKETIVLMGLRADDMEVPVVVSRKEANKILDDVSTTR